VKAGAMKRSTAKDILRIEVDLIIYLDLILLKA